MALEKIFVALCSASPATWITPPEDNNEVFTMCHQDKDGSNSSKLARHDLNEFHVVRDGSHPWFICYQCFKILTDFYMFKQQCYENSLMLERQAENKHEERNISSSKITVKREKMDVEEPEIIVIPASKEEVDHNVHIQEGTLLEDNLEDAEISMLSEEEVNIKEDCDTEIPQMEVRLEGELLHEQDEHQKQVNVGEDASASQRYICEICYKGKRTQKGEEVKN
ncbi:uncharacterized protein [Hetaerina americana]|uniref:uncharacterized protein n=1 Tax=Hetaerina americana TaxID=62018 RepID=UPI003A7F427E